MKINNCKALITGASAGIVREFARQLASRAGSVVLVARRRERLEQLRNELTKANPSLNVHVYDVDLADKTQGDALIESLAHDKIDIDLVINNAGLGESGAFATEGQTLVAALIQVHSSVQR